MDRPSAPRPSQVGAVWRAGKLSLLGAVLVGANVASLLVATWGANRPHEVSEPWMGLFYGLLAAHGVLGVLVLLALLAAWRARGERALRPLHAFPLLLAAVYAGAVLAYFGRIAVLVLARVVS